ncbi:MAG: 3-phosphoshikimate 1-carboxyvinyltransferase, partial [Lachnospiraceae bacterium]|nr:3-phosphoshikimate 1-carboxyvinyltransferase [Lachnospiraceae bacterium]
AQVKSCILLAGLYADGPTTVYEPSLSRNHTELMLNAFGGNIKLKTDAQIGLPGAIVYPGVILTGQNITVPGDISSAAYFIAAGLLVPRSEITLRNVGINQTRDGILRVCQAMGGHIRTLNVRMEGREPVADLVIKTSELHGTNIGGALIPTLIDELPVIAVMAACAEGDTEISDAGELRVKESDRLAAIIEGLRNMGVEVDETETGMIIHGNGGKNHRKDARGCLKGAVINSRGDHRLAMAFTVAGLISSGTTTVRGTDCVKISYPEFYRDLEILGYSV